MAHAVNISISERQSSILKRWVSNRADTPARLVERARIILMSAEGLSNIEQAQRLGVDRQRVRRWRNRWADCCVRLKAAELEDATDKDLAALMKAVLTDEQRPGGPPTFDAEQLTQIIAVACEHPSDSGRPVTHWTPRELADEVIRRGIVESISPRHVDRLLKGGICVRTKASIG